MRTAGGWSSAATRSWQWFPYDAVTWVLATVAAVWARHDFDHYSIDIAGTALIAAVAVGLQSVTGAVAGIYLRRYMPGSFEEATAVAATGALVCAVVFAWTMVIGAVFVPRSVPLSGGALAMVGMLGVRFLARSWASSTRTPAPGGTPVVVFGAGCAGTQLVRQMRQDGSSFEPRALLDDDPAKRRLTISGVRVLGTLADLVPVAERTGATAVVVALPDADSDLMRDVSRRASAAGLRVLVLPPLHEMMHRQVAAGELRDVNVSDLLGRQPIRMEDETVASSITGRRVLVTGAGGSIGSELCRQIARFGPAELILLDRDESALHAVQLSLYGKAMLDGQDTVLVDIRDADAIWRVMESCRPDVVFHAAALKHLPLLEQYPREAWMTNVVGTWNVLNAARRAGVSAFVNISTDKAANPTSVLGYSKRVAERLTAGVGRRAAGTYVSVRFGNVLGSRGSVLKAFEEQIVAGGPVTVTHPEVSRFFMTIAEACQLVLQAAAIGEDGDVMVLDMGEPVRIVDVARTLIAQSGRPEIDLVFTGLRDGEKLHEELFGADEPADERPRHPLVSHVSVSPLVLGGQEVGMGRFGTDLQAREWMIARSSSNGPRIVLPTQRDGEAPVKAATG